MSEVVVLTESPDDCRRTWPAVEHIVKPLEDAGYTVHRMSVLEGDPRNGKQATKTELREAHDLVERLRRHKYVVLVGNTPLQAVTGKAGISKLRGRPIKQGKTLFLPMNNPSIIKHDPNQEAVLRNDLELLHSILEFGGVPEEKRLSIRVVADYDDFKEMLEDLTGAVAYDIETNGLYPWAEDAKITAMGFGTARNQWVMGFNQKDAPLTQDQVEEWMDELTDAVEECVLVTHNGKFDLLWTWVHLGAQWRTSFDTMLAHYLIDENSRHGLKYLAQVLLGAPDWEVDLDTKKGAGSFLKQAKYLAHDVYFTRALRFKLAGMMDEDIKRVFQELMMPVANLFVEIEYDGVFIDTTQFEEAEAHLREQYDSSLASLKQWEPAGLTDARGRPREFNWGSPKQLGELLYDRLKLPVLEWTAAGGRSCSESVLKRLNHPMVQDLLKFREARQQLSFFIDGWRPWLHHKRDGAYLHPSFKLHGTVTGRLSCLSGDTPVMMPGGVKNIQDIVPGDLVYCYDKDRKLTLGHVSWSGKTGLRPVYLVSWSGGEGSGYILATGDHPIRMSHGDYERVDQLTPGSQVMGLMRSGPVIHRIASIELMPGLHEVYDITVDEHHNFIANELCVHNCENPNLQQCPRDPRIRSLISAPKGWTLIECDLSQIELRIAAELSGDQTLLNSFINNVDVHWLTALREIERGAGLAELVTSTAQELTGKKLDYSESIKALLAAGPDAVIDIRPEWKELRKKAKAVNFGFLFSMFWKKFKDYARDNYGVHLTDEEAEESYKGFFALYSGLPPWHDHQRRFAARHGYVPSLTGRKRRLPDAMIRSDDPKKRAAMKAAQRQAVNSPVQSYANDHNLMSALQLRREYSRSQVRICGTVHDAILIRVKNEMVEEVCTRLLEIMQGPDLMETFGIELTVPVEADGSIGPWGKGVSLEKWRNAN